MSNKFDDVIGDAINDGIITKSDYIKFEHDPEALYQLAVKRRQEIDDAGAEQSTAYGVWHDTRAKTF